MAVPRVCHQKILLILTPCALSKASQETNNTDKPTDLPERKFKVEEIEEDEKRQVWELYGPPTPPLRPRQVDAMVCHPLTPYYADKQALSGDCD